MKIAPDAKIDDGLLDVINIGDIRTAKIILNAYTLYSGSHIDLKEVKDTLAKKIEAPHRRRELRSIWKSTANFRANSRPFTRSFQRRCASVCR